MIKRILIFCLLLFLANTQAKNEYSSEDLTILHKEKSATEYIEHFKDISPSKRNAAWQKMTIDMAALYVQNFIVNEEYNKVNFQKISKLLEENFLAQDDYFQYQFSKFAIKYFQNCGLNKQCSNEITTFINKSKRFAELDYELYMMIKSTAKKSALDLIEYLITSKSSEIYCKKEELYPEIKSLLFDRISIQDSFEESRDKIVLLNKQECLKLLKDKLYTDAIQTNDNDQREVLFKTLRSARYLSQFEESVILMNYLLYIPSVGDTFNLAFSKIELNAQNFELRTKLLNYFLEQSYLPDAITTDHDEKRRDIIISLFVKHFPEYFTSYAKECTHFYKGDKNYPAGNPTKNCDKFMELNKIKKWISDLIVKEYERARKI